MSKYPDVATQQTHRATLRKTHRKHPENETIRKALLKSLRPNFVKQAAQNGVFICYAPDDGIFALDLALALREAGIKAFLDELEAGDDWGDTVNQALRDCGVLVMVLSPSGLEDGEVKGEYTYFINTGKIVVPVIVETCRIKDVETMIPPVNFVDDYNKGFDKLKNLLSVDEPAST